MLIIFNHLIRIIARIISLVCGEEPTNDNNGSVDKTEKIFSINFSKAVQNCV